MTSARSCSLVILLMTVSRSGRNFRFARIKQPQYFKHQSRVPAVIEFPRQRLIIYRMPRVACSLSCTASCFREFSAVSAARGPWAQGLIIAGIFFLQRGGDFLHERRILHHGEETFYRGHALGQQPGSSFAGRPCPVPFSRRGPAAQQVHGMHPRMYPVFVQVLSRALRNRFLSVGYLDARASVSVTLILATCSFTRDSSFADSAYS